jgi:hypothetical protein
LERRIDTRNPIPYTRSFRPLSSVRDGVAKRKGLFIPEAILRRTERTPAERLVLAQVAYLAQRSGECWASNASLAEMLGLTERTVARAVADLVAAKELQRRVVREPLSVGCWRRRLAIPGGDKAGPPGVTEAAGPP